MPDERAFGGEGLSVDKLPGAHQTIRKIAHELYVRIYLVRRPLIHRPSLTGVGPPR